MCSSGLGNGVPVLLLKQTEWGLICHRNIARDPRISVPAHCSIEVKGAIKPLVFLNIGEIFFRAGLAGVANEVVQYLIVIEMVYLVLR